MIKSVGGSRKRLGQFVKGCWPAVPPVRVSFRSIWHEFPGWLSEFVYDFLVISLSASALHFVVILIKIRFSLAYPNEPCHFAGDPYSR